MKIILIILLIQFNATLILAQEFDVVEPPYQIRIGDGVMLTLDEKIELLKKFQTDGDWGTLLPLQYYNPFTNHWCIEEWRSIKNYEGYYGISNLGRVKILERKWYCGWKNLTMRHQLQMIKKYGANPRGYILFVLTKENKSKTQKAHHLVWDHFSDKPRNGRILQVDHIVEDKTFNWIGNLQLLNNRENVIKGVRTKGISQLPTGVLKKKYNRFQSRIYIGDIQYNLGSYGTPEEAHNAYKIALDVIQKTGKLKLDIKKGRDGYCRILNA